MTTATAPAVYAPKTGDVVLCCYRLPTPWQHWVHPVHVGVVQEPGDDPILWNGHNSERHYCVSTGRLPVTYKATGNCQSACQTEFTQHDGADSLFPAPEGRCEPWMVKDEAEGYALEHRALAYCGRYAEERRLLVEYAGEVTMGGRDCGPLSYFSRTATVDDRWRERAAKIARWLALETVRGRKHEEMGEHDRSRANRLLRLAGLIEQAPAGVPLA